MVFSDLAGVLALLVLVVLYFIPAIFAHYSGHKQENRILMLNLLLGWTIVGWFAAGAWAVGGDKKEQAGAQ